MLHELPQVTVAAVNGACAGAGTATAALRAEPSGHLAIGALGAEHGGMLLQVQGTVIRASTVCKMLYHDVYECPDCGYRCARAFAWLADQ